MRTLQRLCALGLLASALFDVAWAGESSPAAPVAAVAAVDSIGIPVSDATRATNYYTQVLGFHVLSDQEATGSDYEHLLGVFGLRLRVVRLQLGEERIELLQFLTPRGRPLPQDVHANDRYFQHIAIIVSDMDKAYAWLRQHGVEHASTAPQLLPQWNPNAGGISAFYFRDPDGNFLEILQFPPGKGEPRWQSQQGLFLGIDHTAIVVADTEASLHHYRDLLGMRVVGASENYGTEQEHLNNVFGAHLRITALRAANGPGVELLEYLAPRTGLPIPDDSQANDHWYWQINFKAPSPDALYKQLTLEHGALISSEVVTLASPALGLAQGFVARDPDGHAAAYARLSPATYDGRLE